MSSRAEAIKDGRVVTSMKPDLRKYFSFSCYGEPGGNRFRCGGTARSGVKSNKKIRSKIETVQNFTAFLCFFMSYLKNHKNPSKGIGDARDNALVNEDTEDVKDNLTALR